MCHAARVAMREMWESERQEGFPVAPWGRSPAGSKRTGDPGIFPGPPFPVQQISVCMATVGRDPGRRRHPGLLAPGGAVFAQGNQGGLQELCGKTWIRETLFRVTPEAQSLMEHEVAFPGSSEGNNYSFHRQILPKAPLPDWQGRGPSRTTVRTAVCPACRVTPTRRAVIKKKTRWWITGVDEDVEKSEPSYVAGKTVNWCS